MNEKIRVISYDKTKQTIEAIENPLAKALCAYLYAGCARKGEIVRPDGWHAPDRKGESSIQADNLFFKNETFGKRLYLRLKTTKTKSKYTIREVPLNPKKEEWLCSILTHWKDNFKHYLEAIRPKNPLPNELFPIAPSTAYRLTTEATGFNPHFFRHLRATHYLLGEVTGQRLTLEFVAKIGGWQDVQTLSKVYSGVEMGSVSEVV